MWTELSLFGVLVRKRAEIAAPGSAPRATAKCWLMGREVLLSAAVPAGSPQISSGTISAAIPSARLSL